MKYCANCGRELFDEAVICPGCGQPVDAAALADILKNQGATQGQETNPDNAENHQNSSVSPENQTPVQPQQPGAEQAQVENPDQGKEPVQAQEQVQAQSQDQVPVQKQPEVQSEDQFQSQPVQTQQQAPLQPQPQQQDQSTFQQLQDQSQPKSQPQPQYASPDAQQIVQATPVYNAVPVQNAVTKKRDTKKIRKTIIIVVIVVVALAVVALAGICGYQIMCARYITSNVDTWYQDVEEYNFDDLDETIKKYNIWLFGDSFGKITKNMCGDDYNTYYSIRKDYYKAKDIYECYSEYEKWLEDSIDEADQSTITSFQFVASEWETSESFSSTFIGENALTCFSQYADMYYDMCPTLEKIHPEANLDESDNKIYFTVTNNNFFPITYCQVEFDMTIWVIPSASYRSPSTIQVDEWASTGNIAGGNTYEDSISINISDYYSYPYITYMLDSGSVEVTYCYYF